MFNVLESKRLTEIFWVSMTLLYLMFAVILAYLWIGEKIITANSQIRNIHQVTLDAKKETIKIKVSQVVENIHRQRALAENAFAPRSRPVPAKPGRSPPTSMTPIKPVCP